MRQGSPICNYIKGTPSCPAVASGEKQLFRGLLNSFSNCAKADFYVTSVVELGELTVICGLFIKGQLKPHLIPEKYTLDCEVLMFKQIIILITVLTAAFLVVGCGDDEGNVAPKISDITYQCGPGLESDDPDRLVEIGATVNDSDGDIEKVEAQLGGTVLSMSEGDSHYYSWSVDGYSGDSILCNPYLNATISVTDGAGNKAEESVTLNF